MSKLSENPSLKEINAYKNKLNWGDIPSIYQLASNAIREMDGMLTHGFSITLLNNYSTKAIGT